MPQRAIPLETRRSRRRSRRRSPDEDTREKARHSRYLRYLEFLQFLEDEYGSSVVIKGKWPHHPSSRLSETHLLQIDMKTKSGALKRTLVCVNITKDLYVDSVDKHCFNLPGGYEGSFINIGPDLDSDDEIVMPTVLETREQSRAAASSNYTVWHPLMSERRPWLRLGWRPSQYNPKTDGVPVEYLQEDGITNWSNVRVPLISQVGLDDEEVLELLKNSKMDFCKYPVFKKLCNKLRKNIRTKAKEPWTDIITPKTLQPMWATRFLGTSLGKPENIPSGVALPSGNVLWTNDSDYKNILDIYNKLKELHGTWGEKIGLGTIDRIMKKRERSSAHEWKDYIKFMKNYKVGPKKNFKK